MSLVWSICFDMLWNPCTWSYYQIGVCTGCTFVRITRKIQYRGKGDYKQDLRCTTDSSFVWSLVWVCVVPYLHPRSGELRTQKSKSQLLRRAQNLKVLPLKPGVGQYIAIHATLTARNFFLANVYPSGPFTCICFPKASPEFFLC